MRDLCPTCIYQVPDPNSVNSKAIVFYLVVVISAVAVISLTVPFQAGQIASAADEGMTHGTGMLHEKARTD